MIFAPQNLVMDPPFTRLDLLTCRNLLIYLEPDLQKKLVPMFHYSLNPGGILILGTSETAGQSNDLFAQLSSKTRIYRRQETVLPLNSIELPSTFSHRKRDMVIDIFPKQAPPTAPNLQTLTDELLRHFSPAAVLTTHLGDIVYISAKTGKYLEPSVGKANMNIFAMTREGLSGPLNEAFAKVVLEKTTISLKGVQIGTNGGTQVVDVIVQYLNKPTAMQAMVLIVFQDVSESHARKAPRKFKGNLVCDARLEELALALQHSREEMQITREEMQASQEELKAANEELQSANEELQSTNEELTTSREEMQSMNEELHTVNHELTTKVNELLYAIDDMKNLLNSTGIATLFLDNKLNVRRFTTQTTSIFKLIPGDTGRPITDQVSELDYPELAKNAREVLRSLVTCERQVSARDGRWFSVHIMPYRTQDDRIDGVVITFVDVSVTKALEATLTEAMSILQTRFTDQTVELDSANALKGVLQKAQALMEKRLSGQTLELRQAHADLQTEKRKTR